MFDKSTFNLEKYIAFQKKFWDNYEDDGYIDDYSPEIVFLDSLYAISSAADDKYQYADGFRQFLEDLGIWLIQRKLEN